MLKIIVSTIISSLIGLTALGHGEDVPGPKGGHIRMPGNFHTEVVQDKDGSFHIYLLDMQFKEPIVKKSSIKAFVLNGKKKSNLKCKVMNDHFHCVGAAPGSAGNLVIKAQRNGTVASMDAKYELPIKPFDLKAGEVPPVPDHSKHH